MLHYRRRGPKLDNPAGRLHAYLSSFQASATNNRQILACWADALGCPEEVATIALAGVASLVPEIEQALVRSGDPDQMASFRHSAPDWCFVLFFPEHPGRTTPSGAQSLVKPGSLEALGSISSFLSLAASEGVVPPEERLAAFRSEVADLLSTVTADEGGLPPEVSAAVLDHLHRLLWALDHVRLGGPGAVRAAVEQLIGNLALSPEATKKHSVWSNVFRVVLPIYRVFTKFPEIQSAIESWEHVLKELPAPPLG